MGTEYIHNAIVKCDIDPSIRIIIMATTQIEDMELRKFSIKIRELTGYELSDYQSLPIITLQRNLYTEIDELKLKITQLENSLSTLVK
jgi:hypothetical protein